MPDLDDIDLETDLEEAVALLDSGPAVASFTLKESLVHFHRTAAKDRMSRRGVRKLIHPDNARFLLKHLPADEHERTHAILRGDFVLCDIIPLLVEARGRCPHLHIATLGLSGIAKVIVTRSHAKVICLPTTAGDHFVIEGSANLRSSDNTEQITIYNDAGLCAWHAQWLEGLSDE